MARYADTSRYTEEENLFWEKLVENQSRLFHTAKNLPFTYTIRGNELFISRRKKSLTRSTVIMAYRNAKKETITRSKQLGVFGATYLFPIFIDLSVVEKPPRPEATLQIESDNEKPENEI